MPCVHTKSQKFLNKHNFYQLQLRLEIKNMTLHYDIQKLENALNNFYNATGISIDLLYDNVKTSCCCSKATNPNKYCRLIQSTPEGLARCFVSDDCLLKKCQSSKKPETHICHAGMIDTIVPITYNDFLLGYLILGQIKKEANFSSVSKLIADLPIDIAEMEYNYNQLPCYDDKKIASIADLAVMLTKYILLENMLKPSFNQNIEIITSYINQNLNQELSVQMISKNTHISKSTLYKIFHTYFNCTISKYIAEKRIEKSTDLLFNTDLSIEQISTITGFSSIAYYSKTFKKIKGVSPTKFKKQQK